MITQWSDFLYLSLHYAKITHQELKRKKINYEKYFPNENNIYKKKHTQIQILLTAFVLKRENKTCWEGREDSTERLADLTESLGGGGGGGGGTGMLLLLSHLDFPNCPIIKPHILIMRAEGRESCVWNANKQLHSGTIILWKFDLIFSFDKLRWKLRI